MPWGGYWGGLWAGGAAPGGAFFLVRARAVGARAVRVTFSREPLHVSPIGTYDADNLERWTLTRLDTGRVIPMLGTRAVAGDPFSIELVLAEPFASSPLIEYSIAAEGLHAFDGALLVDPTAFTFAGMPAIREVIDRPRPLVDVQNPQTSGVSQNGSLIMGTSGDYQNESGEGLIKKLLLRSYLTAVGEYYHLADTPYGAGLQPKKLLRAADLVVLRTQLEAIALQQPEFAAAAVTLTLSAKGRLDVQTKGRLKKTNQPFAVQFPLNPTGGSQVG